MSHQQPLDLLPLWGVFVATVAITYGAIELGYILGKYRRRISETEKEGTVGPIVGATLGLLAFMLAFTFGLAASRYDERRRTVVEEANAIGTTYLRAGFLPEPHCSEIRGLLQQYVDTRLNIVDTGEVESGLTASTNLHTQLWNHAEAVASADRHSIMAGLFIETLNDTIDMHTKRILIGLRSRIPLLVWLVLYWIAIVSMAQLGYQAGIVASRRSLAGITLALSFSIVILMIADLDRQREGLIHVSQEAMLDLQKSWSK